MNVAETEEVYSSEVTDKEVERIAAALHSLQAGEVRHPGPIPATSDRLGTIGKILAVIVSVIVIGGALWRGIDSIVTTAITTAMVQPSKDLATITEQDKGLRRDVDRLLDQNAKTTLRSSLGSTSREDENKVIGQIKDAADWALQRHLDVDPAIIQKASVPLIGRQDSTAWNATIALVNLRSYVNSTLEEAKKHIAYSLRAEPGVQFFPPIKRGEWLEYYDATLKLDGTAAEPGFLRDVSGNPMNPIHNIIFKDSTIEYRGGSVTLIDVFFDNCRFIISDNKNGRRMAVAILAVSPDVSFSPST